MEESNISDNQKDISNLDKVLLVYNKKPDTLPVDIIYVDLNDLDKTDISNYNHIVILDILDFYTDKEVGTALNTILEKTKVGTKIESQGIDMKQLCVAVANDDIDQNLAKDLIYGRKMMHNLYDVENYFNNNGCKTLAKRYINIFEYNIIVQK